MRGRKRKLILLPLVIAALVALALVSMQVWAGKRFAGQMYDLEALASFGLHDTIDFVCVA